MFIVKSQKSTLSLANAMFGKIGRIASEDVILQLIKSKCIPSLLYGVDALCSDSIRTFFFRLYCQQVFFMKLFKTNNIDVVKSCQLYFGFSLPSEYIVGETSRRQVHCL